MCVSWYLNFACNCNYHVLEVPCPLNREYNNNGLKRFVKCDFHDVRFLLGPYPVDGCSGNDKAREFVSLKEDIEPGSFQCDRQVSFQGRLEIHKAFVEEYRRKNKPIPPLMDPTFDINWLKEMQPFLNAYVESIETACWFYQQKIQQDWEREKAREQRSGEPNSVEPVDNYMINKFKEAQGKSQPDASKIEWIGKAFVCDVKKIKEGTRFPNFPPPEGWRAKQEDADHNKYPVYGSLQAGPPIKKYDDSVMPTVNQPQTQLGAQAPPEPAS